MNTIGHFEKVSKALESINLEQVNRAVQTLAEAKRNGAFVWTLGNGDSAVTAAHFALDLLKTCGVKAFAIPLQTPVVTAFGNDTGWANMYIGPLSVLRNERDVLVAISCSGNSLNVVRAAQFFENRIILTGNNPDSTLARMNSKAIIRVRNADITVQEDVHFSVCHAITNYLRDEV